MSLESTSQVIVKNSNRLQDCCRLISRFTVAALLIVSASGCNYFIALGYLVGGPPQVEPLFEKETKKSMTDRNVRVAVVCYASDDLKYECENIDHIINHQVTYQLSNIGKIEVVPDDEIRAWMIQNPDWDTASEVGAAFDVNYVIYIDVSEFSLYERDSNTLFRGHCEATVSVYEMETGGEGKNIFSHDLNSQYPVQVPRSATDVSYDTFRMEYFSRLSDEIGRLFYPYLNGDDITNAT